MPELPTTGRAAAGGLALLVATAVLSPLAPTHAQRPPPSRDPGRVADTLATLRVRVTRDSAGGPPVVAAVVRSGRIGAQTDAAGEATLRLPRGAHVVAATKVGLRPDSLSLVLGASDTTVVLVLVEAAAELEGVVVSATRGERRVEDTPLRVEVIDEEEIAEKVAMTPGDIAMMLNETAGLRVQATNPALGGANVRIQGLSGRYSLLLADGLPLYGGQAGGLGLLQIPPVDLGRVEIIKGTASALHGSSALGGVINLVSRRPAEERERTTLVNQTSRGGTDAVYFGGGPVSARWGYTVLAGGHLQQQRDVDGDGWTDLPGYERAVLRPRLYFDDGARRTAFLTGGVTLEDRDGGTLDGRTVPDGTRYVESLGTRRADLGGLARWVLGDGGALAGSIFTLRGSAMEQRHDHRFGTVGEDDRHRTWFAEAALAVPRSYGARAVTYIVGAAFQQDAYHNASVAGFDYSYAIPAAFAQLDADPAPWLSVSTSARLDAHSEYGAVVNPRLSLLVRRAADGGLAGWTTRLSAGTGVFAPTPFTEETEATGLTPLVLPARGLAGLVAERARSASLDVGGPVETAFGRLELNATAFASRVASPLQVRDASGATADGARRVALVNAPAPTRTWGGELLARFVREFGEAEDGDHGDAADAHAEADDDHAAEPPALRITGSYTYLRSTECDPDAGVGASDVVCARREVPLTPRHAAGMVASVEQHGRFRVGLEVYYTGRQTLDDNPYRDVSRPYVLVGLLGERAVETRAGVARLFLNLENLTNVRQTRWDPLLLPARGDGGRWTTDAWTDLTGFTANGGVRFQF